MSLGRINRELVNSGIVKNLVTSTAAQVVQVT